jgi:phage terminase large subunit-like protein
VARPKKRLDQLVRDGTFLARRHEQLLDGPELSWPTLAELQQRYDAADDDRLRRTIALDFERAVRAQLEAGPADRDLRAELAALGPAHSAEQVIGFFPRYLTLENGSPFALDRFQADFLREAYRRRRGRRVYRVVVFGATRGMGKTPLMSGLGTHAMVAQEHKPYVFQIAGSRDQAAVGTDFAEAWCEGGDLADFVRTKSRLLRCQATGGEYRILSSDGRLAHGRKPRVGLVDEWWLLMSYRETQAYVALATALHKHPEAWIGASSTAGYDMESQLGKVYKGALDLPDVEVSGDGCLTIARDEANGLLLWWYGAPEDADIEDPAIIRACNPASWIDPHELLRELNRPDTDELEWKRLHLNIWTRVKESWFPPGSWARLRSTTQLPVGAEIWVAIDAALTYDTSAVVWGGRLEDGRKLLSARVWSARHDVPHHVYVPGGRIRNELLERFIVDDLAARYNIRAVVYDPRYFETEAQHLDEAGLTVADFPQGSALMADACQHFYSDVTAGEGLAWYDPDDVLPKHVDGTAAVKTERGWKVFKLKSWSPIDATVGAIMCREAIELEMAKVEAFVL